MREGERSAGSYGEPIEVEFPPEAAAERRAGVPVAFKWRGRRFPITRVMREWQDHGRGPGFGGGRHPAFLRGGKPAGSWGSGRDYYRVLTETGEVFDIYCDQRARGRGREAGWTLDRKIGGGSSGHPAPPEEGGGAAPGGEAASRGEEGKSG
ncbi:MAG: DUF6504 family protein [Acetobacteraceae bacterium]|nr:DUF6504 family protein [Acetobacteraceae bacterium]